MRLPPTCSSKQEGRYIKAPYWSLALEIKTFRWLTSEIGKGDQFNCKKRGDPSQKSGMETQAGNQPMLQWTHFKVTTLGWRGSSVDKGTDCSCRGPGFSFQQTWRLTAICNSESAGSGASLLWSPGTLDVPVEHIHTCRPNTYTERKSTLFKKEGTQPKSGELYSPVMCASGKTKRQEVGCDHTAHCLENSTCDISVGWVPKTCLRHRTFVISLIALNDSMRQRKDVNNEHWRTMTRRSRNEKRPLFLKQAYTL